MNTRLRIMPLVLATLVACGGDDGTQAESESGDSSAGDSSDGSTSGGPEQTGEELFLGYCAACHGADALGTTLGYELRHPDRGYAEWVVRNGRAPGELAPSFMAAYPPETIDDDELQRIFDHLDAFPQPMTGEGLYLDYCRNCHGPDGTGGVVPENLLEESPAEALEKVREGEGGSDYGSRLGFMPAFADERLTNAEVQSIMDWLGAL
jgi:mono/diheme cytochrome c family protein